MSNPQLLWNFRANPKERNVRYVFTIVNDPRVAEDIRNKLIEALAPVEEEEFFERKGRVGQDNYLLMALNSHKKLENIGKI